MRGGGYNASPARETVANEGDTPLVYGPDRSLEDLARPGQTGDGPERERPGREAPPGAG